MSEEIVRIFGENKGTTAIHTKSSEWRVNVIVFMCVFEILIVLVPICSTQHASALASTNALE